MALAHDTNTRFPAGAATVVDTTTGNRTFSHAGNAAAIGAVVVLFNASGTVDGVTGILYGGVALVKATTASDTSEANRVTVWTSHQLLISGGTQTVTLQGCTANAKAAICSTVTGATNGIRVNSSNAVNTTTAANPTVTVTTATNNTLLYGGVGGGHPDPTTYVVGTNYTITDGIDYGALSGRGQRRTSPVAPGAIVFNFTAASDDWCIAAAAIEEYAGTFGATATPAAISVAVALPAVTIPGGGGGGPLYTDDFTRANGAPGGNWIELDVGAYSITSNRLYRTGSGGDYIDWATNMPSSDHYVEVDCYNLNSAYRVIRARSSATVGDTGYLGFLTPGGDTITIAKNVGYSFLPVTGGTGTFVHGDTHRLRLEVEGTQQRLYVDDDLKLTTNDTTITTGVRVGFNANAFVGDAYDNFEAGNIGAPSGDGTATPVVISAALALPAATASGITPGLAAPAVIARSFALPAPTASGSGGGGGTPTVTLLSHTFVGWDNFVLLNPTVVSSSITPGTNCMLVAMLSEFGSSTSALTSTLPISSGSGPSWTLVEKTNPSSGYTGASGIWTAVIGGSSPGSFTVSATYANGGADHSIYLWSIFKVTDYDTGTPTGGKETTTGNAGNSNVDITLDAAPGSNDVVLAQCLVDENTSNAFSTFGTGTWTLLANGAASGHQLAYNSGYRSSSTSTTVNWSDVNSGGDDWDSTQAAVVIKAGAGGGVNGTATPTNIVAALALPVASATGASPGTATPVAISTPFVPRVVTTQFGQTATPAAISTPFVPRVVTTSAGSGGGAITVVKTAHTSGTTATSVAATFTGSTTVGNRAVAVVSGFSFGATTPSTTGVTDNKGNTWTRDYFTTTGAGGGNWAAFYSAPIGTGGTTHTVTFTEASMLIANLDLAEVVGMATPAFDKSATNAGTGTAYTTGSTGTLAQADEIVFVSVGVDTGAGATITQDATYTLIGEEESGANCVTNVAYKIVSSTAAINHAWSSTFPSTTWVAAAATYKGGAAGAGGTATPAVITAALALPAATGTGAAAGIATPAAISTPFVPRVVTVSGGAGGAATPAAIAVAVTFPGAGSPSLDTTVSPAAIATPFVPRTATGSGGVNVTVTPSVIPAAIALPAVTPKAGVTKSPAVITTAAVLPAPTKTGSGNVAPAVLNVLIALPPVSTSASTTLTVASSNHAQTAQTPSLTGVYPLTVSNSAHVHTATSPAVSTALVLGVAGSIHAHTAGTFSLVGLYPLTVANSAHAHTVGQANPAAIYPLTVSNSVHALTSTNVALSAPGVLGVSNSVHGHTATTVTVSPTLEVAKSTHTHIAGTVSVGIGGTLTVANSIHAHSVTSPVLTLGGATLTVSKAVHVHTVTTVSLAVGGTTLVVRGSLHAHAVEGVTLTVGGSTLTVADSQHALTSSTPSLKTKIVVLDTAVAVYLGTTAVQAIYAGPTKVWPEV